MKKNKFYIVIVTNNIKEEYNLLGEYDNFNKIIHYYESNKLKSSVTIDIVNHILIKENIDYKITLNLDKNKETVNEILLKKENKVLSLKIKTKSFSLKNSIFTTNYMIIDSNEQVDFKIMIK